jgi:hypothetical protein
VLQEQVVRDILPATRWFFEVEPRGVEPLTSAVQSQGTTVVVQKDLQIRVFTSRSIHGCSPMFMWVGVLLVYTNLDPTPLVLPTEGQSPGR